MSDHHTYTHEAMKTTFTLRLVCNDATLANQVASACIARIDEIEARLNRYLPGSDVWQINHMQSEQSLFVSEDCHDCLLLALQANQATHGLFDSTLGRLIEHTKQSLTGAPPALAGKLMIDPKRPAVHCIEHGREIDLGGIGKGFALDRIAELCKDWEIESGLLSAGASTQLAFGNKSWDITLQGDRATRVIQLDNQALSASGSAIQGSHILSPFGANQPYPRSRVWVVDTSAAWADAFSTAALLAEDLTQLQHDHPARQIYTENEQTISSVGNC